MVACSFFYNINIFCFCFTEYDFDTRYDNIKELYPDKTIIIWASAFAQRYEDEVNEYLSDNGFDFVICFENLMYGIEQVDENGEIVTSYTNELKSALEAGNDIDIIDTNMIFTGFDTITSTYQNAVANDWLVPLDEYFENSDAGKALYSLMPEKYWESLRLNGNIYGFDGSLTCLKESAYFELNTNLVDGSLELSDLEGDYVTSLNTLKEFCEDNDYRFDTGYLSILDVFDENLSIDSLVSLQDGEFVNIYETDLAQKLFDVVAKGYKSGVFLNPNDESKSRDISTYLGSISSNNYESNKDVISDRDYAIFDSKGSTAQGYTVYPKHCQKIFSTQTAVGVSAASNNKELAFEALCEIYSDEELNNLICYGDNYDIVDGCVQTDNYYDVMGVENKLLRLPFYGVNNSDCRESFKKALEDYELDESVGFSLDTSEISEQLLELSNIALDIEEQFPTEDYNDSEEYLESINQELYDAGMQDVLDEINRQYEEWSENEK